MSLSDILDEKEYVLVDFWASWCGPCIATFPALKDLYASFGKHGFEIVSVSIDDTRENWSYMTEEHELPWINLGELEGFRRGNGAVIWCQFRSERDICSTRKVISSKRI